MQKTTDLIFTLGGYIAKALSRSWVIYGLIFVAVLVVSLGRFDPDLGWHLRSGEQVLEHGAPEAEPYTYTASDFPWVHHEWLADGINFLVYDAVGYPGLAVMHALLWTFGFWSFSRKHRLKWPVLLAVLAVMPLIGVRAMSWMVGLLGILYILLNSRRRYIWLLPPLFALWANLHGSFLVGIAYAGYVALRRGDWRLGFLVILSLLATLINPYGIHLYDEIIRTVLDGSLGGRISEWASLVILPIMLPFIALWLAAWWQLLKLSGLKAALLRFDVLAVLAMVSSWRHAVLFSLFALPLVLRAINQLPKVKVRHEDRRFVAFSGLAVTAVFIAVTWLSVGGLLADGLTGNRHQHYPRDIMSKLKEQPCQGNIFNDYDIGGYMIWQLPEQKVYIDGRMPSWQHDGRHYFEDYLAVIDDADFRQHEFEKYNITCVILPSDHRLAADLLAEGWRVQMTDQPSDYVLLTLGR